MDAVSRRLTTHAVPCQGCRLCCQGDAVRLEDEDLNRGYETEPHPYIPGALMIAHKPDGDCVYLDENGCTIHGRAPALCRAADCRSLALAYDLRTAQTLHMMGRLNFDVWDRGNQLIAGMKAQMAGQRNDAPADSHRGKKR